MTTLDTIKHLRYDPVRCLVFLLKSTTKNSIMKKRVTAILLAWFLGGFGGQKFYLGKTGAGVLSILFFWTFIPAFIALYDIIRFACMSNEDFDKKFNSVA